VRNRLSDARTGFTAGVAGFVPARFGRGAR
jgi:hypothetical protein